jgi:acetyl-CoA carboxylase carboxyl transferase subunit beta
VSLLSKVRAWFRGEYSRKHKLITHFIKDGDERLFVEKKHECPACHEGLDQKELEAALYVCPNCDHHFRVTPWERIKFTADGGVFHEFSADLESVNPLDFPDYDKQIAADMKKTGLKEAIVTGICRIEGREVVMAIMAFQFRGGSVGSVVGEKLTRAMLLGAEKQLSVVVFTASGGMRMQEGILSLMQMAKTAAAANLLDARQVPFFIVLTDPTSGGTTASFGMLGDVILSEPGALVGFAGRRVVDGTLKEKLPDNFQTAEFQLEKGFVDAIVPRKDLRRALSFLIDAHTSAQRAWK